MEQIPWFVEKAVGFIDNKLVSTDTVFEYGAGGSTLWFASRAKRVVSVEHDKGWYEKMRDIVPKNVTLLYIPRDLAVSFGYESRSGADSGKSFKEYVSIIDSMKPFDWVIVDGRARVACMRHAVKRCRKFLVLDNSERHEYMKAFSFVENFKCNTFVGPLAVLDDGKLHETRIWEKE